MMLLKASIAIRGAGKEAPKHCSCMARRIRFKEGVFADFVDGCNSDESTDKKIRKQLETLSEKPERGFKIPFSSPLFYQLPIGEYMVHYHFSETHVDILYLGIPGKC